MLFYSNFFFINFEYHVWTLENLITLNLCFFLLRTDAYHVNVTDCFYGFWNIQKTELCMLQLSAFFLQLLVMSLKQKFPSLMSNNNQAIYKDLIFDAEIDHKCCVKNLLRFPTNKARTFKEFCEIGFLKIRIVLKLKRNNKR